MRHIDVFNGDADGLCALRQLRLAEPVPAELVTGPKRDIELVRRVSAAAGDEVTVLDVDFDRNRKAVLALLEAGVRVRYFAHHGHPKLPSHPLLDAHVSSSRGLCTSLLVDRHLAGRHGAWAVVGAFGDGMAIAATERATALLLDTARLRTLRELGETLNYNAYGESEADLFIAPAALYRVLERYDDQFEAARDDATLVSLAEQRRADLEAVRSAAPLRTTDRWDVYVLPNQAWSRRVSGVFANRLAFREPRRVHAVLTHAPRGGFRISVRTPSYNVLSAGDFCRQFPGGGGRAGAGGVDHLDERDLDSFIGRLDAVFAGGPINAPRTTP